MGSSLLDGMALMAEPAMASTEPSGRLVLNPDIEIISVREFPPEVRERLGGSASDFILSDRTSRIGSQRVGHDAAMFLRRFREPRRIVQAIIEHSTELKLDPRVLLDEVHPLLTTLRRSAVLVDPVRGQRRTLGRALSVGDWFEGFRILESASHLAETDVYKAVSADGLFAAIKYVRAGSDDSVRSNLRREAHVLERAHRAGCRHTPRLYGASLDRDDPYLSMEWLDGRSLLDLIHDQRSAILERANLVASLVEAYVALHAAGVLHGDVHPRNALHLADGAVRLVDFGGARLVDEDHIHPRIGLVHFYEPEVAHAVLAGREPPAPGSRGEQYCVAGLAYSVITGGSYLALSLETETALKQIISDPPRRFEVFGVSWPALEDVLARGLRKEPADRYDTLSDFRAALMEAMAAIPPQPKPAASSPPRLPVASPADRRDVLGRSVRDFIDRYGLGAELARTGLTRGPRASLYAGSAGIAWALLRVALLRQEPATLAAADLWSARAQSQRSEALAFTDGSVGAAVETGELALFHSATGLHVVNALIRHASGDTTETRQSIVEFIKAVPAEWLEVPSRASGLESFPQDATNGAASLLLGAALLWPICDTDGQIRPQLMKLGKGLTGIVKHQLELDQRESHFLGFAHGRTGAVCSLLRWFEVAGFPGDAPIGRYLDELASFARRRRDGLAWPIDLAKPEVPAWTGWCHGSAGHLLTWTTASRVLKRSDYLELALAAGRHIWQERGQSGPSLCCGGAGEALALYELARASDDKLWIDRGRKLATQAARTAALVADAQGLFRAEVGISLAAADSTEPATSAWPVCQSPL